MSIFQWRLDGFSQKNIYLYIFIFGFFENRKNSGLTPGQNDDPDVKDDPLTRWPNDPVPCLGKTIDLHLRDLCWSFCRYQNGFHDVQLPAVRRGWPLTYQMINIRLLASSSQPRERASYTVSQNLRLILHLQIYCGFRHLLFNHRWSVRNIVEAFYNTCYPCCKL